MADKPANRNNPKAQRPLELVAELPDLMRPEDYLATGEKKLRLRISLNENGVEILGDALHVTELEKLLARATDADEPRPQARTLCG